LNEVLELNPAVNEENIGGLLIEKEGIVDPWQAVYKFAEVAENNGAHGFLNSEVTAIEFDDHHFNLTINEHKNIKAKYIVNAAGLFADDIARMIQDDSFTITPRKGQFIVTKSQVDIKNIVLPVPTPTSKGKLVIPAVFKGHLLGPTAEDHEDKYDLSTNKEGFEEIRYDTSKLVPASKNYHSVKQYSGNRSVSTEGDFIIRASEANQQLIHAAGIRSTGLSASPGIAEMVLELLEEQGLKLSPADNWNPVAPAPKAFDDDEIICLTRNVTRGEIKAALASHVAPKNIDGLKRRTTVILGECQGSCCIPKILDIMKEMNFEDAPIKNDQYSTVGIKI
jgi:glycerol-3-phosphate dehydrogenase